MAVAGTLAFRSAIMLQLDSRPTSSASHPFGTFPSRGRLFCAGTAFCRGQRLPLEGKLTAQLTDEVASFLCRQVMAVAGTLAFRSAITLQLDSRPTSSASHSFGTFPSRGRLCPPRRFTPRPVQARPGPEGGGPPGSALRRAGPAGPAASARPQSSGWTWTACARPGAHGRRPGRGWPRSAR